MQYPSRNKHSSRNIQQIKQMAQFDVIVNQQQLNQSHHSQHRLESPSHENNGHIKTGHSCAGNSRISHNHSCAGNSHANNSHTGYSRVKQNHKNSSKKNDTKVNSYLPGLKGSKFIGNKYHPLLSGAEHKLFQQIAKLIKSISQIQHEIKHQKQNIRNISGQLTALKSKKHNGRGYSEQIRQMISKLQRPKLGIKQISKQQLGKIQIQNQRIQRNIQRLQIRKHANIKELLSQQKNKNAHLHSMLNQKNKTQQLSHTSDDLTVMGKLQKLVNNLQLMTNKTGNKDSSGLNLQYMSEQALRLRDRILYLSSNNNKLCRQQQQQQQNQRIKLEQYLQEQSANKILFLDDLQQFRSEYEQLRQQNQSLKKQYSTFQMQQQTI